MQWYQWSDFFEAWFEKDAKQVFNIFKERSGKLNSKQLTIINSEDFLIEFYEGVYAEGRERNSFALALERINELNAQNNHILLEMD